MKQCSHCRVWKDIGAFPLRKEAKDGHRGTCRVCRNNMAREKDRTNYYRQYRQDHKEELSIYRRKHNRALKLEVMNYYGGAKCACCGENNLEFLCFDHIDGGGTKHRKAIGNMGRQFYYWLKLNGYPTGYRVLCYNCNMSFGFYGYCPHERKNND